MREIIFRGKRIDNNEWIYGLITTQIEKGITEKNLLSAITSNSFGVGEHQVDTETIGQFTGLTDKNKRKIFEGDIVKHSNGQLYTIRYICGGFDCEPIKEFYKVYKITWNTLGEIQNASWCESNCEIVGNIWDNPEMIKEAEDE